MKTTLSQLNRRILIVDDNSSIHADFREILCPDQTSSAAVDSLEAALFGNQPAQVEKTGFELSSAFQGQQALEMVKKSLEENKPYALAFVDVRMPPGWDGIETIAKIWEVNPELQIVVCTAYSDYSWQDMRNKVGHPDNLVILKKPFDNVEVQQLAHALTKKWNLNREAERNLRELTATEERFSNAFNESPIPSAIQSLPNRVLVDVNERFAQVTGFTREELLGHTPEDLFLWDKPADAGRWYDGLHRTGLVRDRASKIRHRNGALRDVLVSVSPTHLGGKPHALLLAQDISEQVMLETQLRQAQKMEAIGQLAAGVAHDFNNILTVIQGHAGLLLQKLKTTNQETKSVDQINLAANRAATLVRQLLMFSRKQIMQFRHLNLNDVLRNSIRMLERLVGEHVEIKFEPQAQLASIYADSSMIEQIVMNFAVNARDAMPRGGCVTIRTSLEPVHRDATPLDPERRDGDFICLTFSDTGAGMDTQILNRIFEPFFTTKPAGQGTGLGLSTVFGIVRQHQGWLDVTSKVGEGTMFRVYLPATQQAAEKSDQLADGKWERGRETVLVAEDEAPLRQMVVHILKIQGYTVLEAESGQQALAVWEQSNRKIDLLLTDMVMPGGVNGRDLAEKLADKFPGLKVIYTSGYSPGMAGKDTSALEGRNFLPKPYSISKLTQFVRECLDGPENGTAAGGENMFLQEPAHAGKVATE
jgi:PAS domain S-box-containing protein